VLHLQFLEELADQVHAGLPEGFRGLDALGVDAYEEALHYGQEDIFRNIFVHQVHLLPQDLLDHIGPEHHVAGAFVVALGQSCYVLELLYFVEHFLAHFSRMRSPGPVEGLVLARRVALAHRNQLVGLSMVNIDGLFVV